MSEGNVDQNVTGTAEDIGSNLGSGGTVYQLSTSTIGIIVCVVVVFLLAVVLSIYMRKLQIRRKIDMINKARARAVRGGLTHVMDGQQPGDPIALTDLSVTPDGDRPSQNDTAQDMKLPECPEDKHSLWHYINWKDPYNTKVIKPNHHSPPS